MSDDSRKQNFDRWITITNLVLTAIIGIGVALYLGWRDEATQTYLKTRDEELAKYLADRDEQFQERLVQLQADVDRQANLANLSVKEVCAYQSTCTGAFQVTNAGPAAADNVVIVAYLPSYAFDGRPETSQLDNYSLLSDAPSSEQEINTVHATAIHGGTAGSEDNAFKIALPSLPSGTSITYSILWTPNPSETKTQTSTLRLDYSSPDGHNGEGSWMNTTLTNYFDQRLHVATFTIDTSCANCDKQLDDLSIDVGNKGNWRMEAVAFYDDTLMADYLLTYDQILAQGMRPTRLEDNLHLKILSDGPDSVPRAVKATPPP